MKKEIMSFKNWLLRRHLGRDTRIGDLARDVRDDASFPDTEDFIEMHSHIVYAMNGCRGAEIALMEAYVKWYDYTERLLHGEG